MWKNCRSRSCYHLGSQRAIRERPGFHMVLDIQPFQAVLHRDGSIEIS